MEKILVVAAHPDDEILGIGGTVRRHVNQGDVVWCIILAEGMKARNVENREDLNKLHEDAIRASKVIGYEKVIFSNFPDNKLDTVALLDITKEIEKYVELLRPDIIYTHHSGDLNIDHRRAYEAVITASRPIGDCSVKKVYTFETPSSTEWQFDRGDTSFLPNTFIDIRETIDYKLQAMACYLSEIRDYPHPRSLKALEVIAARWGSVVGKQYVEALHLVREIN